MLLIKVIPIIEYMKDNVFRNNLNVTLPPKILNRIDEEAKAKDMTRSRYVLRLLEKAYSIEQGEKIEA